jgi:ClpX C4-type zinc finger
MAGGNGDGDAPDDDAPPSEARLVAASPMGMGWSPFGVGGPRRCSFCGRREDVVEHLVHARGVYICDACVGLAQKDLAEAGNRRMVRIKPRYAGPSDRDAAEDAVESAFETVFSSDASDAERRDAIEGGANLAVAMQQVRERFPARAQMDISVESVRFLGDDEAEVHFRLIFRGPMGGMAETGYAVHRDGAWKVARETWCRLVSRIGVQCPPAPD